MKISYNWLKTFVDVDLNTEELSYLLTDIGLEVEGIEEVESVRGGLKGLVVGEVLTCEQHPDADKLKVTTVRYGEEEDVQVVCGAPNVAQGQKIVFAPVGITLYPYNDEGNFKIKKAKIRGVESLGMICAEDEIGLGESHDGIIILPESSVVGTPVSEIYQLNNDTILEIGLTPNRPDAQSHYGVARDLAVALNFRKGLDIELKKGASDIQESDKVQVNIDVIDKDLCPRYAGLVIEGLKVEESPDWLKERLHAIGINSINNVVDITNYILHSYGQPLHAFDMEKVGDTIQVKTLETGTKFRTLDDEKVELDAQDLMICNASEAMCIAGVYGGIDSGVKDSTTSIFLESAYFLPTSIRKTSMRHNMRTEAAQHFEKGIDPQSTVEILKIAARMIIDIVGGQVASKIYDVKSQEFAENKTTLEPEKVRRITGANITNEQIKQILTLLEIKVDDQSQPWQLSIPLYRADVTRDVDIIEEVLRIYSYNKIEISNRINAAIPIKKGLTKDKLYQVTSDYLAATGFYEMLNNSLTKSKNVENIIDASVQVKLLSSINAELDILRPDMLLSALDVLSYNINRSQKDLKLFEYGKVYTKNEKKYIEEDHLFLAVTGKQLPVNWNTPAQDVDFYYLKGIVESILQRLGIKHSSVEEGKSAFYDYVLTYYIGRNKIAMIGRVVKNILAQSDIKQAVFAADFYWDFIFRIAQNQSTPKVNISKYPSTRRDLAILLDKNVKFTEILNLTTQVNRKELREINLFDVYEGEKIEESKKSYAVSYVFCDDNKTMSDKEVDKIVNQLIDQYSNQLGAVIRGK
ncbi:MAG: phenylalanine--tRNA ligase subunit beta [Chitinophagales bacterium]|nr:phenylalanine--tRNA ligase subunit beta [Chitinophagales bacterium]